jgi:hypothetical protein
MIEETFASLVPSSAQVAAVVLHYVVFGMVFFYTLLGAFLCALFLKRSRTEAKQEAWVEMHNNSAKKWFVIMPNKPTNDNTSDIVHRHVVWVRGQPDPDNVA